MVWCGILEIEKIRSATTRPHVDSCVLHHREENPKTFATTRSPGHHSRIDL